MNVTDVTDVSNLEQVARHLLEANANIEHALPDGFNSLLYACNNGHADVRAYSWVISFIKNLFYQHY